MGDTPPDEILERPELFEGLAEIWRAFWFLDGRRVFRDGGYPQPIQASEIKSYLDIFGEDMFFFEMSVRSEKQEFIYLLCSMDDFAMSHMLGKIKQAQEQNGRR